MGDVFDMRDFVAAADGDKDHMLGKFLYFTLANLLVEKEALSKLCEDMGIAYTGGKRLSVADAFRSATGDIQERYPVTEMGKVRIYRAYCRDNERTTDILSRELVKETLNQKTNHYEKLANISYDKSTMCFAAKTWCQTMWWTCAAAAAGRRSCLSSTNGVPTASRWRPSAQIIFGALTPPS